jgi:hypothetical protein
LYDKKLYFSNPILHRADFQDDAMPGPEMVTYDQNPTNSRKHRLLPFEGCVSSCDLNNRFCIICSICGLFVPIFVLSYTAVSLSRDLSLSFVLGGPSSEVKWERMSGQRWDPSNYPLQSSSGVSLHPGYGEYRERSVVDDGALHMGAYGMQGSNGLHSRQVPAYPPLRFYVSSLLT